MKNILKLKYAKKKLKLRIYVNRKTFGTLLSFAAWTLQTLEFQS